MLKRLIVRNYAIIRELDMEFCEGLTIITGETGAGKSILLGALSLVLGDRADTSVLLNKDEKCVVEAYFNIKGYNLEGFFSENEIDYDDNAIMRREINSAGKSRAFVNDTPVNLNIMREIGDMLIDIHSQHQTLLLGSSHFQLRVLDSFAGATELFSRYRDAYSAYNSIKKKFELLSAEADRQRADFEYYSHQLEQLKAANLIAGEQEEMQHEQEVLSNAGIIRDTLAVATRALSGDEISAVALLKDARNHLAKSGAWIQQASELSARLETALIEISDISYEAEKLLAAVETDPGRMEFVTQRLDTIYSLLQKHRCKDVEELLQRRDEIASQVVLTGDVDNRLLELGKAKDDEFKKVSALAKELSDKRKKKVPQLVERIVSILKQLGMPHSRFDVRLTGLTEPSSTGFDRVDFLFSANSQVAPEELSRVASGGELSRVMLSLKSTLASTSGLPAIVFDEIDSGVSGEVASMVGAILSDMARSMQVINITHLPQVASRGDYHYHVYKEDGENTTRTRIRLLTKEERLMEVARLLSGSTITEAAVKNARELLENN
jgi:DNA repair protein RecN (Recombination protein N)